MFKYIWNNPFKAEIEDPEIDSFILLNNKLVDQLPIIKHDPWVQQSFV